MSLKDRDYFNVKLERQDDESLWLKCKACSELIFKKRVRENNNICPKCGEYFFLTARERIESLIDDKSFTDISKSIIADDPLNFIDSKPYLKRIEEAQANTELADALILGSATINGKGVIIAAMEFRFVGGSMGSVMGEQICHGMEEALRLNRPFILISSSGGARMQEGVFSLFQMAKTSAVRAKLSENKILFISIMTYPTTGGVAASIASLGDVIIAEKGALIGFAGRRVIQNTTGEELPDDFQTDAFALSHGSVDRVVSRENLRDELSKLLSFFLEAE
ncbi:acetyl-CoA carboxylase, carboxyltransferase subunit beta [Candidatus Acetothermia bacterium]|jgi:acetyl-CoA carboxylase carboxyl transferase subunit beta|nr:acetyl-CoA carboxylase, carboxyltransferase subunit beta [Candidatus Acetothermia bacterium]MCI2427403.1 acetyl-CoA carboxylase, carboxyltransferase subunit beta [Candidatus Acetothermia bacterium]MCI2428558.1 acetyl-CoA carboxylase, carboxyltransferase subunit beta [Candidatus Acetothermia bacterium]